MAHYQVKNGEVENAIKSKGWHYSKVGENELKLQYCPYCCEDKDPSNRGTFVINTKTGQYHCFRANCTNANGNFVTLAVDFGIPLDFVNQTRKGSKEVEENKEYKVCRINEEMLQHQKRTVEYFEKRGISAEIACGEFLCFDNDDDESIVIPFLVDCYGTAPYVKFRHTDPYAASKETSEAGGKPIFFGLHRIIKGQNEKLLITEGQIDAMSIVQAEKEQGVDLKVDIVSVPTGAKGFNFVRTKQSMDFLNNYKQIIVMGDNENGIITMVQDFVTLLQDNNIEIQTIPTQYYLGCKDANDILIEYGSKYLVKAIQQAKEYEVSGIWVDEVPADDRKLLFSTSIKELNSIIGGGFYTQSVNILTGFSGEGKTSLANCFIASAMEQGIKTLVYSGEATPYEVKRNIHKIMGGKYVVMQETKWGVPEGILDKQYSDYITIHYKEQLCIIDTQPIHREIKPKLAMEMLINKIKEGINRYGCEFIVVDNMMTAVCEDKDLYSNQSVFIKMLTDLANQYKVCVLLLAHPRKEFNGATDNGIIRLADIAGTGNIANLSTTVISYQRYHVSKKKKDEVDKEKCIEIKGELRPCSGFVRVLKNRINGNLNNRAGDECCVFYHKLTGRILEKDDYKNYVENHRMMEYSWSKDFEKNILK